MNVLTSIHPPRVAAALAACALLFASTPTHATRIDTPSSSAIAALVKRIPEVRIENVALTDVVDYLRDITGANIEVDWKNLELIGIGRDTSISLRLRNIAGGVVLKKTLDAAAPGLLTFYVEQNVITVTTIAVADERLVTRVYAVDDLLLTIPDFAGPRLSLTSSEKDGATFEASDKSQNKSATRIEAAQVLIDLIQTTIRPTVWETNGGTATIRYLNGNLIITAPISVHGF